MQYLPFFLFQRRGMRIISSDKDQRESTEVRNNRPGTRYIYTKQSKVSKQNKQEESTSSPEMNIPFPRHFFPGPIFFCLIRESSTVHCTARWGMLSCKGRIINVSRERGHEWAHFSVISSFWSLETHFWPIPRLSPAAECQAH